MSGTRQQFTKRGETVYYVKESHFITSGKLHGKVLYHLEDKDGNKFFAVSQVGYLDRAKLHPNT